MKTKLLLIEDDTIDQKSFKKMVELEDLPYDVKVADSVASAREMLAHERLDIVVTDYQLGDGTSAEIFGEMKGTPFIVVTGEGSEKLEQEVFKSGASDYLIKEPNRSYLTLLPMMIANALQNSHIKQRAATSLLKAIGRFEAMARAMEMGRADEVKRHLKETVEELEKSYAHVCMKM